jgi:hypothetical protein
MSSTTFKTQAGIFLPTYLEIKICKFALYERYFLIYWVADFGKFVSMRPSTVELYELKFHICMIL